MIRGTWRGFLPLGVTLAIAAAVGAGCGGSESVVTVVKTETVAAAAESTATRSDEVWIEMIRRQAAEVDDLSSDIAQGEVNPTDAVLRVTALENEFERGGLVGTSPCIQESAAAWGTTLRRFTDAFAMLVGAIPEVAKAAAERFSDGPPVRDEAELVLDSLDECVADLGGVGASGEDAGEDGITAAIQEWVSEAPASADNPERRGVVWLLHEHARLNTAGWTVSERCTKSGTSLVVIRAKKDVPVYVEGDPRPDLGTEPFSLLLAIDDVGGASKVVAASGGNFVWRTADASAAAMRAANEGC